MQLLAAIDQYLLIISLIIIVLGAIAEATGWKWDDKVVRFLKNTINLLPGRKLYDLDDLTSKKVDDLVNEEKEYRNAGAVGRLWKRFKGIFRSRKK